MIGPSGWCLTSSHEDCIRVFRYSVCNCTCHPEPTVEEKDAVVAAWHQVSAEGSQAKKTRKKS